MKTKYVLTILILIVLYSFCYSQDYWESIYSSDSNIHCLAINSIGYLFTGTQNGIYRSIDSGNSWEYIGLENISVYCLTINSNNDIYTGTGGYYNIYRSVDNGENWISQYSNPNAGNIISLTINSYGNIFAGSFGDYSIIRSTDNGASWELILSLSDCEDIKSIIENSEGILFAGTTDFLGGGGVYRSLDNGENWEFIGLEYEYISSLAINSDNEIFAGSRGQHYEYGGGVFRSSDNGETWTELRNDVLVTSIAIDSEDKIYIGCSDLDGLTGAVHFSEDNGESWQLIESEIMPPNIGIEFITISEDDFVYAISYESIRHIYRSVQPTVGIDDFSIKDLIDYKLRNYPNPFNPAGAGASRSPGTTISYDLPANVTNPVIEIFNIKGEKIVTLSSAQQSIEGRQYEATWDGTDSFNNQVSSGVYLYRIKSDEGVLITNKMLLMK